MSAFCFPRNIFLFLLLFFSILTCFAEGETLADSGRRNIVTLEYLPVYASFALGSGGLGLGYERELTDWFSLHTLAVFGYFPAGNGGQMILSGFAGDAVFSPFSALRSLKFSFGAGFLYLGATGEDRYGGLEAHYFIPYISTSVGWRLAFGRKRLRYTIQPEIVFALVLPGPTGSGISGDLEWYPTGYVMGVLYPNVTLGVQF